MECSHFMYTFKHRGEALDTMVCLLCGHTWYEFWGEHQVGSLLMWPDKDRRNSR